MTNNISFRDSMSAACMKQRKEKKRKNSHQHKLSLCLRRFCTEKKILGKKIKMENKSLLNETSYEEKKKLALSHLHK